MPDLAQQRCCHHAEREAVARCPGCSGYFCRECISEHDRRVLCADCLRKLARVPLLQRRGFAGVIRIGQFCLGLFLAWFCFYALGEALLALPDSFHEGTVWESRGGGGK